MKKILITGATDGIGLETAKSLVSKGHQVLIHGRNDKKLAATVESLKQLDAGAEVSAYQADLSSLTQTQKLIDEIIADHNIIDVIINNAGVLKTASPITQSGLDVRFVVNTLSPYLIAKSLQGILADDGRIVNLSSAAQAPVDTSALAGKRQIGDDFQAYAQSKLALTIWSQEMAKQMGPKQVSVAVNPGSLLASKMVKEGFGLAGNDLSIGSDILVAAAISSEFTDANGLYYDNDSHAFAVPHSFAAVQSNCNGVMVAIESLI